MQRVRLRAARVRVCASIFQGAVEAAFVGIFCDDMKKNFVSLVVCT